MLDDPTPTTSELRQLAKEAKHTPSQELSFRQFYTNEWLQLSASAWLSVEDLRRCVDPRLRLDQFIGAPVWIGFDSALKDDSASVAVVLLQDNILYLFAKSFLPKASIQRYTPLIPEYRQWVQDGQLEATEGAIVDLGRVRDYIVSLHQQFQVRACVVEMFAAGNLPSDLQRLGLPVEVAQKSAKSFTPAALDFEARVRNGLFRYDGRSHATWMLTNACVERRVNGSLLPKKDSREERPQNRHRRRVPAGDDADGRRTRAGDGGDSCAVGAPKDTKHHQTPPPNADISVLLSTFQCF